MIYLTRRERFSAAHKLYQAEWSAAKNKEIFGKCANANFHGHNYEMFVTVKGRVDPQTGFVINAKELSSLIKRLIVDKLDHSNLNEDVDFMKGILPSTENLVKAIWVELASQLTNCQLHCIKIVETENIYVEYYGE